MTKDNNKGQSERKQRHTRCACGKLARQSVTKARESTHLEIERISGMCENFFLSDFA